MHFFISKKSCSALIFLLILCLSPNIEARNQTTESSYDDAIDTKNYELADSIVWNIIFNCSAQWDTTFDVANFLIDHYERFQFEWELSKRLDYLRQLELCIHIHSPRDFEVIARLQYHYAVYFRYDLQEDSMQHHLNLLRKNIEHLATPTPLAISLEYEQARLAYIQNDQAAVLTYLQNALSYLDQHFPEEVQQRLNILNGIGIGLRRTFQLDKAIEHHHSTLEYLNKKTPGSNWVGTVLNNVGLCYQDLQQFDSAIYYMKKAISYYGKQGPEYKSQIGSGLFNICTCLRYSRLYDSAMVYGLSSKKVIEEHFGNEHPDLLLPYICLTRTSTEQGDLTASEEYFHEGMRLLKLFGWKREDPSVNAYMQDVLYMLGSGIMLARARYLESGREVDLFTALSSGEDFMKTVDYAYDYLKNSISRDILQGQFKNYVNAIIDNQFLAYQALGHDSILAKTFEYFEKFKALDLLYAAQRDKIDELEIYQDLIDHQKGLVTTIHNLQTEITRAGSNVDTISILDQELNAAQEAMYRWRDEIRKEYPNYHDLLYHPQVISLSEVSDIMTDQQSVLTYFVSDTSIYSIVINKDEQYVERATIPSEVTLDSLIYTLRNTLLEFHLLNKSSDALYRSRASNLTALSSDLYTLLIEPIENHLKASVLISPHKVLGYLPFDLLIKEKPEPPLHFRTHLYFFKKHALHFTPSITLWSTMQDKSSNVAQKVLAVAPAYTPVGTTLQTSLAMRNSLQPLLYNEEEVDQVLLHLDGVSMKGREATKTAFLRHAEDYGVIHFAMHGKASDEDNAASYLAFSNLEDPDFKLYMSEIYNLSLQSDLVTISACESGLGQLRNAEGVISLARAFSFAGAKSILSTLWSINDQSTSSLMDHYYKGLKDGLRKEVALQEAKLTYLEQSDHTAADPFYWSSFMLIGDTSPIASGHSPFFILLPIGLAAFMLLLYVRYRSQNKVG